jgi:ferredoxin
MSPDGGLRLTVDWIRCDGYGTCGDLLPEVIGLDDWRFPILPREPVDPGLLHDVQRAIDCCPMKALRLERPAADR